MKIPLGTGIYSPPTAARLVGIAPRRVYRWVRGSETPERGGRSKRAKLLLARDLPDIQGHVALSFLDLIEVRMVKAFLDKGVGIRTIRAAAVTAAELFKSRHPFCLKRMQTDGRSVFARLAEGKGEGIDREPKAPLLDLAKRQLAIREVMDPLMLQIDYESDVSARWWPLGHESGVVLDPRRSFGLPLVSSCSVPTDILSMAAVAEGTVARAASWYQVKEIEVHQAVAFERWLAAA